MELPRIFIWWKTSYLCVWIPWEMKEYVEIIENKKKVWWEEVVMDNWKCHFLLENPIIPSSVPVTPVWQKKRSVNFLLGCFKNCIHSKKYVLCYNFFLQTSFQRNPIAETLWHFESLNLTILNPKQQGYITC